MKIKTLLFITMTIGVLSCDRKESSEIDKLIGGVWILDTASNNYETLDFKEDLTYKFTTGLIKGPKINSRIPIETECVTGKWKFENNEITFTSAQVDLNSDNLDVDNHTISRLYGFQSDHILQDICVIDRIISMGGDTIFLGNEYEPIIWIIEELNDNFLTIKSGIETIRYKKQ